MQQLYHRLKDGKMEVNEVPFPICGKKQVLVRNHYSVISPGTEGRTASDARKGYVAKARSRKEELEKVVRLARQQGLKSTYNMVMRRLESPAPLGYSCAGEVIAVGEDVRNLKPGDRVACGGNTANHAEIVAIPEMLCVHIPEELDAKEAAFTTLGSIAYQGIRQAELQSGSRVVVIGLGLIGMLSIQILEATGIQCLGIDLKESLVKNAAKHGATLAIKRDAEGLEAQVLEFTRGLGADAVLICASTSSTDPVDLAGSLAGKKAKVVIVGNVPTGFQRKEYYRKELDLRMSMSYGPGRYDPSYEEHGLDYPAGYVRWTENRNMQAFIDLIASGKIRPSLLISHKYKLEEAPLAFDLMLQESTESLAILIAYDQDKEPAKRIDKHVSKPNKGEIGIGVVGAGSYANNIMFPLLKGQNPSFRGIASARGLSAKAAMDKYGFAFSSGEIENVVGDKDTQAIFVFTRHDSHAPICKHALHHGKHVFVEKPIALDPGELNELKLIMDNHPDQILLTGFNRRFAQASNALKKHLPANTPRAIHIRINAGKLPKEHWVNDVKTGGGRIVGEVCHFIDLACHLSGSEPTSISATSMRDAEEQGDTLSLLMNFENGSIASISYFSNGNPAIPKEEVEVFSGGVVGHIHDWKTWSVKGRNTYSGKSQSGDKGHAGIIKAFFNAISKGKASPIAFEAQYNSMMMTFAALKSIREQRLILLEEMTTETSEDQ